jgi:8-oxo-dGTP pyrophosphatase MutT (NUDIX family)
MNEQLPQQLGERLTQPLPGSKAHARMAPDLSYGRQFVPPLWDVRQAAVIMLLYPHQGRWHLPLTLRPAHLAAHAGQISFPGGAIEYGESSQRAALRELEEELGISTGVEIIGKLSPFHVYISNFRVVPWLGLLADRPRWQPDPAEVDQVLEVPLAQLLDPAHRGQMLVEREGLTFSAPYFAWQDHKIWGATSMMLGELVEVVRPLGV